MSKSTYTATQADFLRTAPASNLPNNRSTRRSLEQPARKQDVNNATTLQAMKETNKKITHSGLRPNLFEKKGLTFP